MTSAVESEPDLKFSRGGRRFDSPARLGRAGTTTSTTILLLLFPCSSYDAHTRPRTHMVHTHTHTHIHTRGAARILFRKFDRPIDP